MELTAREIAEITGTDGGDRRRVRARPFVVERLARARAGRVLRRVASTCATATTSSATRSPAARPSRSSTRAVPEPPPAGAAIVQVDDAFAALAALGVAARERLADALVVGITGSSGKTGTKDLTAGALGRTFRVHASPGSFNNEIGLPLTLLGAPAATEVVVARDGRAVPRQHRRPVRDRPSRRRRDHQHRHVARGPARRSRGHRPCQGRARSRRSPPTASPSSTPATTPRPGSRRAPPRAVLTVGVDPSGARRRRARGRRFAGHARRRAAAVVRAPVALGIGHGPPRRAGRAPGGERGARGRGRARAWGPLRRRRRRARGGHTRARADGRAPRPRSGTLVIDDAYNANPASMAAALRVARTRRRRRPHHRGGRRHARARRRHRRGARRVGELAAASVSTSWSRSATR